MPDQMGTDIHVGFRVDLSDLQSGFKKAEQKARELEGKMGKSMDSMGGSFLASGKKSAAGIAMAFTAVSSAFQQAYQMISTVANAMVDYARQAEYAEKATRYFDSVFGSLADKGHSWAAELADSYGLYTTDVEAYMASLMDGFQRAGNGLSESYRMAKQFTQLSYDLSAFFPQYSLEEIQDMLKDLAVGGGEEALEKLTAGFDEEALKAKAVAMGIADIGEELTVLQKQKAASAILEDEYGDMQGLYADTENVSSAMTDLDASTKNLKETLGNVFAPVVEFVAGLISDLLDAITEKIQGAIDGFNKLVNAFKKGINWLARLIGGDDIWDLSGASEGAEQAAASTSVLDKALESLEKQAADTKATMEGMAGFDRLWTVKNTAGEETAETPQDWETAFDEWLAMFITMPDEAVDKMNPLWDKLLNGNQETVDEFKDQYGEYFDWILDSELANSEISRDERQNILDGFYDFAYAAQEKYEKDKAAIQQEYSENMRLYELGQTDMTLEEIEAKRSTSLDATTKAYRMGMNMTFKDVLDALGITTKSEADAMEAAFRPKIAVIEDVYKTVMGGLRGELDDLNAAIAEVERRISAANNSVPKKSAWDKLTDWAGDQWGKFTDAAGDIAEVVVDGKSWEEAKANNASNPLKLGAFAEGGLFEPNNPQLVIMGDNTVEPEVAAPRSMIEQAMQNVIDRNGGGVGGGSITIPVTLEIDGKAFARAEYKYLMAEAKRSGKSLRLA